eukprot:2683390-Amphidinium_carterae.1
MAAWLHTGLYRGARARPERSYLCRVEQLRSQGSCETAGSVSETEPATQRKTNAFKTPKFRNKNSFYH